MSRHVYAVAPDGSVVVSQTDRPYTAAIISRLDWKYRQDIKGDTSGMEVKETHATSERYDRIFVEPYWVRVKMSADAARLAREYNNSPEWVASPNVVLVPVTDVKPEPQAPAEAQPVTPTEEGTTSDPIQEKIDRDKSKMSEALAHAEQKVATLLAALDVTHDAERAAWGDPHSEPPTPELHAAWDKASKEVAAAQQRLFAAMTTRDQIERKLAVLDTREEYDRRAGVAVRINHLRGGNGMATSKTPKQTAKDQGVPDVYLSGSGNFKPGMDARYKSDLIAAILGEKNPKALMTFEAPDASRRLEQRGWEGFLAKATAARAAAAERKAKKAAAAKAKPAAKKSTAKAAGDVSPDPKPDPKPKSGRRLRSVN